MADPIERPKLACCKLLNLLRKLESLEEHSEHALPPEVVLRELEEEFEAHLRLEEELQREPGSDVGDSPRRNGR